MAPWNSSLSQATQLVKLRSPASLHSSVTNAPSLKFCVQNNFFFLLLEDISLCLRYIKLLKPTGHVMHQQVLHSTTVRSAHTVFLCFVFIWEQTATCATYSINWLVFITEMKSVYSAVRTGSLNKAVCA